MGFEVTCTSGEICIRLSGWDRAANWRRELRVDFGQVTDAYVESRGTLEDKIDSRVLGIGPNFGWRHPGDRRVGTMLGRGVIGKQFWAVSPGPPATGLLVLNLSTGRFARVVVEADLDVESCVLSAVGASRDRA